MTRVDFEVPARAEYVSLVRMVVSSLAASRRDVEEELLDNLKLAVSEACTLVVEAPGDRLAVSWTEDDADFLVIEVSGDGATNESKVVPFQIMRALVDKVEMIDGSTLRLSLRCPT